MNNNRISRERRQFVERERLRRRTIDRAALLVAVVLAAAVVTGLQAISRYLW
jgi:hypothetical protein